SGHPGAQTHRRGGLGAVPDARRIHGGRLGAGRVLTACARPCTAPSLQGTDVPVLDQAAAHHVAAEAEQLSCLDLVFMAGRAGLHRRQERGSPSSPHKAISLGVVWGLGIGLLFSPWAPGPAGRGSASGGGISCRISEVRRSSSCKRSGALLSLTPWLGTICRMRDCHAAVAALSL